MYVLFKGGNNQSNHGCLDIGQFLLDRFGRPKKLKIRIKMGGASVAVAERGEVVWTRPLDGRSISG